MIETPALEHIENLTSRQGGDNEKLTFKVMKRGAKLEQETDVSRMCDCGLRYDLTVPLARFYANNRNNLPVPFNPFRSAMHGGPKGRRKGDSASSCSVISM